jgi:hypothetical protein
MESHKNDGVNFISRFNFLLWRTAWFSSRIDLLGENKICGFCIFSRKNIKNSNQIQNFRIFGSLVGFQFDFENFYERLEAFKKALSLLTIYVEKERDRE